MPTISDYETLAFIDQAKIEQDKAENERRRLQILEEPGRVHRVETRPITIQPGVSTAANISANNPPPESTLAALRVKQNEIIAAVDSGDRFNRIASLAGAVEAFKAEKVKKAQELAYNEVGVNELQAALDDNIRMDRNTPSYFQKYGTADSDETAKVRAQYQSALASANALTGKYISTDPELNAVAGEFDSFLKIQSQLTADAYKTQAKLKEYGENIQKVANYVTGGEATPDLVIKNIVHYSKLAEIAEDPAMLVQATLQGKDPAVSTLLAHKQAEKLSGTSDMNSPIFKQALQDAQTEIKVMKGIQTDTAMFEKAVKDSNIPEAQLGELDMLKRDTSVAGQRAYAEAKGGIALAYIRQNTKNKFLGDVDSWITTTENGTRISPFGDSNTALGKAYAEVKKVTPTVSVQSLVGAFKNLPPADRPVAEVHLKSLMRNAKDHASTGYFGQFADDLSIEMEVNQKIVQSLFPEGSILGLLGQGASAVGIGLREYLNKPAAAIAALPGAALATPVGEDYFSRVGARAEDTSELMFGKGR